jgi:hypothetical protein
MDLTEIDNAEKGGASRQKAKQAGSDFNCRIGAAGSPHIFYLANNRLFRKPIKCVNLIALQRMNLHFLQKELVDEAQGIIRNNCMDEAAARKVRTLLHEYCKLYHLPR